MIIMEHKNDGDTSCNWNTRYSHRRIGTGTGGLGKKRTSGNHPNYSIIDIGWNTKKSPGDLMVWFGLLGFYGISTFVGYLTPNPFLCKLSVLFKTIQLSISTQFNCQKYFYFKLFKQLYVTIQLCVNTVLMSKTVLFQIIQLSISTQFKYKYSLSVKNISISSYSVYSNNSF